MAGREIGQVPLIDEAEHSGPADLWDAEDLIRLMNPFPVPPFGRAVRP